MVDVATALLKGEATHSHSKDGEVAAESHGWSVVNAWNKGMADIMQPGGRSGLEGA
jgi:hypothetical protein